MQGCRGVPGWAAASGKRSGSGPATRQLPPDPALTGHATPTAASYPSVTYKLDAHPGRTMQDGPRLLVAAALGKIIEPLLRQALTDATVRIAEDPPAV